MKSSFKKDIIACILCFVFFMSIFLFAVSDLCKANLSLKNWDNGELNIKRVVCTDFYLYKANHGDSWEFEFSDNSHVSLDYNVQNGFDEDLFREIMHRPLDYVYAEPAGILVDIRDGDVSLLDQEYSRRIISNVISSRAFLIFMLIPLPMFPICLFAYVMIKHNKSKTRY